jgi:hypothetical protein
MADKKYIKKMNMPVSVNGVSTATDLYVKDEEAVSTINGYSNKEINAGTVTFADTRITEEELTGLFPEPSN